MDAVHVVDVGCHQQVQLRDAVTRHPIGGVRQQVRTLFGRQQIEAVSVVVVAGADGVVEWEHLLQYQEFQHV